MLLNELIVDIFTRLPVESLVQFICLSKLWSQVIVSSQFFLDHLHHVNQTNKKFLLQIKCKRSLQLLLISDVEILNLSLHGWSLFKIVGSCNGLLLFLYDCHSLFVLNPSIKRLKFLPDPPLQNFYLGSQCDVDVGFGYDSSTNDFKVVRILSESISKRLTQVQVYSQIKNSLKVVNNSTYPIGSCCLLGNHSLVYNGAFYCFVNKTKDNNVQNLILLFDFIKESFKEIALPDCFGEEEEGFYKVLRGMGESKGKISFLVDCNSEEYFNKGIARFEIWMMPENSAWNKQLTTEVGLQLGPCQGLLWMEMNDQVVLLITMGKGMCRHLISYDLKTVTIGDIRELQNSIPLHAFTYTLSLALLGEENHRFMNSSKLFDLYLIVSWNATK
ncbi:hypothetical protein SLA2020_149000 [Shorea laevis]